MAEPNAAAPLACPRCGERCFDNRGTLVHGNGYAIGSCPRDQASNYSWRCPGCGWRTNDTRYEQHTCQATEQDRLEQRAGSSQAGDEHA